MRMFEALGSGSFLLTDTIPEDQNVFREGVHFVGYSNMNDMIDKAKYYLEHEDERAAIAARGQARTLLDHTYAKRMQTVSQVLTEMLCPA